MADKFTSLLLLLLFPLFSNGQDLKKSTEKIRNQAGIPGLSVAYLAEDGSIRTSTFGQKEAKKDAPVDNQTLFSAASLSKPVVAYIVLQLVDQGKLNLDTPLADYYDYEDLNTTDFYRKVTARHVLSHTTGLPNWRPRGSGVLTFKRAPGEKFGYSGEGYVWLSRVLQALTGKAFEELAQEMVFQPLSMQRTSYIWRDSTEQNYAIPHDSRSRPRQKYKPDSPNAAASLQTTASDYARFLQAVFKGERLSAKSKAAMLTEQVVVQAYDDGSQIAWGLGVGLQQKKDGKEYWHWGDNGTFKAYFTVNIESGEGLVYFANSSNGLAIVEAMTDLYLGTEQPAVRWNDYPQLGFWYWLKRLFR